MTIASILLAIGLVALSVAMFSINIIFKKGGKFPNTHVSGNKLLKEKGVYCIQTQDKIEQRRIVTSPYAVQPLESEEENGC